MAKIWIEVCLISARGVRGSSPSLWKRQWYAVGWVDPKSKYCTKVDASSGNNANPVWRTKFAVQVDNSDPDLALHVEVYSRDPVFLTEKLHGSATVVLREFLAKQVHDSEEVGSYQLRKKKSNKPSGFVDVSIRVSEDKEEPNFHPQGDGGGIVLLDYGNSTHLPTGGGFGQGYPQQKAQASFHGPDNKKQAQTNVPYSHPVPFPADYATNPYVGGPSYHAPAGPSYQPPRTTYPPPPPPPPPSNVNYAPNFFPNNGGMAPSYFNMPSSSSSGAGPRPRGPPGFAIGAGAGALAAGAVMFGDNFMSGFDVPSGLGDPTLTIATDPLF